MAVLLIGALGMAQRARGQGLQTINPPEGGQITYGQVAGETTEAGAMGSILRNLHQRLGDRPRVGSSSTCAGRSRWQSSLR
jgi:hypothetical protein